MIVFCVRFCERALIVVGLVFLAIYGFFRVHAWFFQAYDSWSFDQSLRKRSQEVESPGIASHSDGNTQPQTQKPGAWEETLDYEGWAPARILAYERSLARPPGTIVGRLLIPALDMNVMVLEGTDRWTLNRAAGHIEGTALPGQTGNVGISAHRDGFFRSLGRISQGDEISLVTLERIYTYQVESTQIVNPSETQVLEQCAKPILTLVTCYPFYFVGEAPQRFIVQARLVR
jgi:sortase A